jgi:hypothetical protein
MDVPDGQLEYRILKLPGNVRTGKYILCAGYFDAFPVRETISIEKQVPPVSYSPSGDSPVRDECPDGHCTKPYRAQYKNGLSHILSFPLIWTPCAGNNRPVRINICHFLYRAQVISKFQSSFPGFSEGF